VAQDERQAILELICGNVLSQYKLEVMLTNGDQWRVYALDVTEMRITVRVMDKAKALRYIASYLQNHGGAKSELHSAGRDANDDEDAEDDQDPESGGGTHSLLARRTVSSMSLLVFLSAS
jgi:hypothetical protein